MGRLTSSFTKRVAKDVSKRAKQTPEVSHSSSHGQAGTVDEDDKDLAVQTEQTMDKPVTVKGIGAEKGPNDGRLHGVRLDAVMVLEIFLGLVG